MSFTRFAIEKSRITLVAVGIIYLGGLMAYQTMPRSEDPPLIIRSAMVLTHFPGASPERVEMLVTDKLEKAIQEMPEIDSIVSQSKNGVSIINVNIQEKYKVLRPIWDKLRRKVDAARSQLPSGIIGPNVNDEFGDVFGTLVTLRGEGYSYSELKVMADEVRDELLLIEEVAKVEIEGAQEERVFVEYNNARLAEVGLSPAQLRNSLEAINIIIPGGSIKSGPERFSLEPTGNFESVQALRRSVIQVPGRRDLLYLEDIANVYRGYIDPPQRKTRCMGEPCLVLAISLREGGNIITLGERVSRRLGELEANYPIGVELGFIAYQAEVVDAKIADFVNNLMQAIGLVILVMLLTLGLRTGLLVASLIPSAIIMSLMLFPVFDIGLDQLSLAALIIALGMLVDNAIVMAESILVQMEAGKSAKDAAVESASELRVALLTSSLTTSAAFLPIFLAESSTGEYTANLFRVVTITLLCSWILALTLIPLLCVQFMRVKRKTEGGDPFQSRAYRAYRGFLLLLLRNRVLTLVFVFGLLVGSLYMFRYLPALFFPPKETVTITGDFELPIGTAIEETEAMVHELEAFIAEELANDAKGPRQVETWASFIGQGAPRFVISHTPVQSSPGYAGMIINATSMDPAVTGGIIKRLEDFCLEKFPDLEVKLRILSNGPPVDNPVDIRISGRDIDQLFAIVGEVEKKLSEIPGTKNISNNWGRRSKKLLIDVHQPRARRAGVSSQDVAVSLQSFLSGIETTQYREGDKVIPVTMRSVASERRDAGMIESMNIFSQATGQSVPLKQVADVEVRWQTANIKRRDRLKSVSVLSQLQPGYTAMQITNVITPWLEAQKKDWPVGYKFEFGGEFETSGKANKSIADKMPIGMLIILMLLISQFNSIRRAGIILSTIFLGIIGVVWGLLGAGSYFGFMTLLGIISLAGIVINNAIVLLERINIETDENGLSPAQAVVEAAQRRMRPILLTTATTVGGLLPLWLGGGAMWEPMAIAIIFGLLFSTVLTLGVVPVLYSLLFGVSYKGFVWRGSGAS